MPTMTSDLRVGDLVRLVITWGSQRRLKCKVCTRFLPDQVAIECRGCGTRYHRTEESTVEYRVEALP